MQEDYGPIELNEHLTDTEIRWAICYLDPDLFDEGDGMGLWVLIISLIEKLGDLFRARKA